MANHPSKSVKEYGPCQAVSSGEEEYQSHTVIVKMYIWWRMLKK